STVVTLAVRDKEDGLRVRTRPTDFVVVPARGTSTITAQVVPMSGALDGEPHAYELEFRGHQPGPENTGACDVVRRARFTYVPRRAALWPPARPHRRVSSPNGRGLRPKHTTPVRALAVDGDGGL